MTDNLDGNQTDGTTQPTTGFSEGEGDKQLSNATKLQSTLDTLVAKVGELDARYKTMQSGEDRGISKTMKEVSDLKRKIAEYEKLKKAGYDEDGAIEEQSFREDIRSVKEQLSKLGSVQPQTPAGNGQDKLAVDMAKVIDTVGLDFHDAEVIAFMRTADTSDLEKLTGQAFLLKKKLDSKPNPSLETSPSLSGRSPAAQPNREQLAAELSELQNNPTKDNKERRAELVKKLRTAK